MIFMFYVNLIGYYNDSTVRENAVALMEYGGTILNHRVSRDNKSGNVRRFYSMYTIVPKPFHLVFAHNGSVHFIYGTLYDIVPRTAR